MAIVTVKNKYQVVISQRVRDEIGVDVGDVLQARPENGKIVFEPKSVIDRFIAESIAEFQAGPLRNAPSVCKSAPQRNQEGERPEEES